MRRGLADIINFLPDPTFAIDSQGRVIAWNQAMEELTALKAEEIVGKGNHEYGLPFYGERYPMLIDLVLAPDEVSGNRYGRIDRHQDAIVAESYLPSFRGGTSLWAKARPLYDSRGAVIGAIESLRDITEVKQAEKALQESEKRYRNIFENAVEGIFQSTADGRYLSVNPAWARMCGFGSPEEMIREVTDIAHQLYVNPEDRKKIKRLYEDPGVVKGFEAQFRRKDGGVIWVSITARSVRDENGNLLHYEGIIEDITERKEAEKALRESEEKYRTLVEALPHAVAIIQEARVVFANRAAAEMFRVGTPEQLIATDAVICSVDGERKCLAAKDRKRLSGMAATPEHYETTLQRTDGDSFPAEVFVRPVVFRGRRALQVAVIDITERKRAEIELQRYQEQLRFLASELSLTEARERRRLATDLHDSVGQTLAMSKLRLDALRSEASSPLVANESEEICKLLDRAIQDTRFLTFELSPPVLYELGIEAALESLAERMQQVHGIPIKLSDDRRPKSLSEDTAVFCFRAVQELLINAVKHARPREIEVSIRREGDQVRITVADDGIGFDPREVFSREGRKGGFGLFSITERLQLLGGSLKVDSKAHQGTRVTLFAPVGA